MKYLPPKHEISTPNLIYSELIMEYTYVHTECPNGEQEVVAVKKQRKTFESSSSEDEDTLEGMNVALYTYCM